MDKLEQYWEQLVEPKFSSQDHEVFHSARNLAALILVLLPVGLLVITVSALLDPNRSLLQRWDFIAQFPAALALYIAYYLSRRGDYRLASGLTILVISFCIFIVGWGHNNSNILSFVIVQVMLSGMLLLDESDHNYCISGHVFLDLYLLC